MSRCRGLIVSMVLVPLLATACFAEEFSIDPHHFPVQALDRAEIFSVTPNRDCDPAVLRSAREQAQYFASTLVYVDDVLRLHPREIVPITDRWPDLHLVQRRVGSSYIIEIRGRPFVRLRPLLKCGYVSVATPADISRLLLGTGSLNAGTQLLISPLFGICLIPRAIRSGRQSTG